MIDTVNHVEHVVQERLLLCDGIRLVAVDRVPDQLYGFLQRVLAQTQSQRIASRRQPITGDGLVLARAIGHVVVKLGCGAPAQIPDKAVDALLRRQRHRGATAPALVPHFRIRSELADYLPLGVQYLEGECLLVQIELGGQRIVDQRAIGCARRHTFATRCPALGRRQAVGR